MSYAVIFNTEALREYKTASLWYEEQWEGLGARFEIAVENKRGLIR